MSYQSKKSLYSIVSTTLMLVIYSFIFYSRYQNGFYDNMSIVRFWSIFILLLIPLSVLTTILSEVFIGIALGIKKTLSQNKDDLVEVIDERDRLIELKVSKISQHLFVFGFSVALLSQYFELSLHYFFIIIIVFGFLSEVFEHVLNIHYREKGIR